MAKAAVCLWAQLIDNDDSSFGGGRQDRGLINNNRDFSGGQGIDNVSKGSETTKEATGAR